RRARPGRCRCARPHRRRHRRDRGRRDIGPAADPHHRGARRRDARRADRAAGPTVRRVPDRESRAARAAAGEPAMSAIGLLVFVAVLLLVLLVAAAFLTWIERRLLAWWQDRYGPNRAGPFGLLQAFADVIKILLKEDWLPPLADKPLFVIAPAIVAVTMLLGFAVVPFAPGLVIADLNVALLFFF